MGDIPADNITDASPSSMEEVSGKLMVAAIIGLFMVIVFVCFLHLYARWFWSRRGDETRPTRERRRRFVFAPSEDPVFAVHRGLEPSVVRSLPIVIFHANDFKDGLECAVCLSELEDGEKARLLPNCNHGFHVECIDMWFQSHSTCPLCRDAVGVDSKDSSLEIQSIEDISGSGYSIDSPDYPTNVLFWGNQTQFSTRGGGLEDEEESAGTSSSLSTVSSASTSPNSVQDGGLVIEIPRLLDVLSSASPSDEMKSPIASPMMTRLRSFRRLLSREKRVIPNSPTSVDVELGEGGAGQSSKTSSES